MSKVAPPTGVPRVRPVALLHHPAHLPRAAVLRLLLRHPVPLAHPHPPGRPEDQAGRGAASGGRRADRGRGHVLPDLALDLPRPRFGGTGAGGG